MAQNGALSANQIRLVEWLATPKGDREHTTQAEFAESIGVSRRTILRWVADANIQDAYRKRSKELLSKDLADVYEAIKTHAIDGSFQHAKLWLEMIGEHQDKPAYTSDDPLRIVIEYATSDDDPTETA